MQVLFQRYKDRHTKQRWNRLPSQGCPNSCRNGAALQAAVPPLWRAKAAVMYRTELPSPCLQYSITQKNNLSALSCNLLQFFQFSASPCPPAPELYPSQSLYLHCLHHFEHPADWNLPWPRLPFRSQTAIHTAEKASASVHSKVGSPAPATPVSDSVHFRTGCPGMSLQHQLGRPAAIRLPALKHNRRRSSACLGASA